MKLREADRVIIITGKYKGKEAIIKKILVKQNRVVLDGVIKLKKHVKATKGKPEGGIKEIDGSIAISNLMYLPSKAKVLRKEGSRLGSEINKKGEKMRLIKKTGQLIK